MHAAAREGRLTPLIAETNVILRACEDLERDFPLFAQEWASLWGDVSAVLASRFSRHGDNVNHEFLLRDLL